MHWMQKYIFPVRWARVGEKNYVSAARFREIYVYL